MMRKSQKRWLIILLFISILSASSFNRRYKKVKADEAEVTEVTPYKKPSGNANSFLGIPTRSGYILQPDEKTYIQVNQTKTINADARRSLASQLLGVGFPIRRYQWYKSTDGKTWSEVPKKESGREKKLPLTPTETGTTYYQMETYWGTLLGWVRSKQLYSNVATVYSVPDPVDATSVEVTTDDDYLYNSVNDIVNIETYAHAIPTPENFTGTVSWSIDNTNLATIEEDTGLITANTNRLGGVVTVTATLHNPIGDDITGSTEVLIGGGLEDQTVKAGKTATFDLRGNIGDLDDEDEDSDGDSDYTVKWYKEDPITHARTQILKDQPQALSYTTPETTLDDDGTIFLAIIQVKYNGKTYSYTTEDAYLHVLPEGGPNLELHDTLTNKTFQDKNDTDTVIFGVNNDDLIRYNDTVTNESTSGTLSDADYTLPLRKGTQVASVKLDGTDTTNYKLVDNDDTNSTDLVISGLNFKINESHDIEVDTTVTGIDSKTSYTSVPYITGKNDDNETYQKFGTEETLNYTTNSVVVNKVNDIDYGTINSISAAKTLSRPDELNLPNNMIEIEDMRRFKKPLKVSVSQTTPLQTDSGDVFAGQLRFYKDGQYTNLLEQSAVVAETKEDEELVSLGWEKENGILLYLESKWNVAGVYKTQVNWTISDSV
ncbi:hypothetical protein ACFQAV_01185 [Companilactobacillus huachuanensis]|uniref:BIG2 domain-containing protein n=1 Tax=Companilactobacillus huachuanensis TaxID=2559914 RepID=A0ABW1RJ63_9LACO|nr:hypothetical protein [Companilactobacillus huachuanensis]